MNLDYYAPPTHNGLILLYQDEALLALNKPSGLLSVPGRGEHKQDCLASRVQLEYPEALVVHRLDMGTSGIILMARCKGIQAQLGKLFEQRLVKKRYLAIVAGHPEPAEGEINLPLIGDWPNRPKQKVDQEQGKPAKTLYQVLSHNLQTNTSRVELTPLSGRSHQLRVHMSSIGHPILGDQLYATGTTRDCVDRLQLHAEWICLNHPATGAPLAISCPVPF